MSEKNSLAKIHSVELFSELVSACDYENIEPYFVRFFVYIRVIEFRMKMK